MPIQSAAMPRIAAGENIVLHSATGSGKTLAFLVPLLASIKPEDGLRVVVAAPSQELAVQIATEAERLLSAEEDAPSPHSRVLLAISSSRETELEQHDKLFASSKPPQVMVGTPQRLADLCRKERARPVLRNVRSVVLDEVDLMLPPVPQEKQQAAQQRGRGAPDFRGRGARGRGGGRGGRGGRGPGRGITVAEVNSIERRLTRTRPAEVLLQRIERARPRSAPPLQLISSSATISPDLLRTIGAALGGVGKSRPAPSSPPALRTHRPNRSSGLALPVCRCLYDPPLRVCWQAARLEPNVQIGDGGIEPHRAASRDTKWAVGAAACAVAACDWPRRSDSASGRAWSALGRRG